MAERRRARRRPPPPRRRRRATWLSLIIAASKSPKRCGRPPPWTTACFSRARRPGVVLRVAAMRALVPVGLGDEARRQRRHAREAPEEVERPCARGRGSPPPGRRGARARRRRRSARRRRARSAPRCARRPGGPPPRRAGAPESTPASRAIDLGAHASPVNTRAGEVAVARRGPRRARAAPLRAAARRCQRPRTLASGDPPSLTLGHSSVLGRQAQRDVALPVLVVALGEVLAQVDAARLLAQQRRLGDLRRPG